MRKIVALFLILFLPGLLFAQTAATPPARPLVLTHVTVIDVTGASSQPDMTVIVSGNRIAAVGRTGRVRVPPGARLIDAGGKFLIPGLWDMHVHALVKDRLETFFPLFITNGVTGVRNMGSPMPLDQINQLRQEIQAGRILAPRIFANGPIVDGPKSGQSDRLIVTNETEARRAVDSLKRQGADFIKVYNNLSRESFFTIADESKKLGITFAGHIPISVSAAEASDAGQKSFEHMGNPAGGLLLSCSSDETQIRRRWVEAITDPELTLEQTLGMRNASIPEILDTFQEDKAQQLIRKLVKNHTWQTPTLSTLRRFALLNDNGLYNSQLKYLIRSYRERLDPRNIPAFKDNTAVMVVNYRRSYQKNLELAGKMHRAGVQFLAGTDTPFLLAVPGFSLHDELELLVTAGLSPVEALRAATLNPARFLGEEKDLGTVEKGKLADLVLLDANPLENISNTKKIDAVVLNGRLLDRRALDKMLADVEAAANKN